MTIEDPPKLHVIVGSLCGPRAFVSADEAAWDRDRLGRDSSEWVTKPQAYVREDDANAEIAEARQAREEEGGLRREIEADRDAVRRERDALLAERDAVAREGWRACVLGVSIIRFWQAETKSRSGDQRGALALMNEAVALRDIFTADDKAAGKGVG